MIGKILIIRSKALLFLLRVRQKGIFLIKTYMPDFSVLVLLFQIVIWDAARKRKCGWLHDGSH